VEKEKISWTEKSVTRKFCEELRKSDALSIRLNNESTDGLANTAETCLKEE